MQLSFEDQKAVTEAMKERLKMEINKSIINGINFYVSADKSLISAVQVLFRAIEVIPIETVRDGYKLEIGFSVFIFIAVNDGYKITAPDYLNGPFFNTTDDLTIDLWILLEQTELLKMYGIEGVSTRFDDEIVIAKNALENSIISLQRYSDLGKGESGWCVEAIEEKPDETFKTIATKDYESFYVYQLLQKRPSLIKVLALPYEYLVVFDGDEINEILNEKNESIRSG